MAATQPGILRTLRRQGYEAIMPVPGLTALHRVLLTGVALPSSNLMISSFSWPVFLKGCSTSLYACFLYFVVLLKRASFKGEFRFQGIGSGVPDPA